MSSLIARDDSLLILRLGGNGKELEQKISDELCVGWPPKSSEGRRLKTKVWVYCGRVDCGKCPKIRREVSLK